tara:strand:+ start:489 stop:722 length:234 start_codon:yes stop_codon:yes gene_type:complete
MKRFIILIGALIGSSVIHAYYYPWLYNIVNTITQRTENLDDEIDILNMSIVFLITSIMLTIVIPFIVLSILKIKIKN